MMELERFICAFDAPYEGAKCFWNDQVVFVKKVVWIFKIKVFIRINLGLFIAIMIDGYAFVLVAVHSLLKKSSTVTEQILSKN